MKKALITIIILALVGFVAWEYVFKERLMPENDPFTVEFIVDGEVYDTVTTAGGEIIELPENPEKAGFVFGGWYLDEGVWNMPFSEDYLMDTELTHDICVYAKWAAGELAEYRVEYYLENLEKNGYEAHRQQASEEQRRAFLLP